MAIISPYCPDSTYVIMAIMSRSCPYSAYFLSLSRL